MWSGSDAGNDESTVEPMVEPLEQMRDHVEVPPATSPVDAPMDIAPPEVVPEAKKKSATIEKVKKKKTTKVNRKDGDPVPVHASSGPSGDQTKEEEMESVVTIQQPASPCRVSLTSEKGDADTDEEAGRQTSFARSNALTQGMPSLHQAASMDRVEEAKWLLEKNLEKPDTKHIDEEEAEKNLERPEKKLKYIDEVKKDPVDNIPFRCTALQVAAFYGKVGMVELLVDERADINSFGESEQKWSPLHLAGMRGHTAAVELLLDEGADYEAKVPAATIA